MRQPPRTLRLALAAGLWCATFGCSDNEPSAARVPSGGGGGGVTGGRTPILGTPDDDAGALTVDDAGVVLLTTLEEECMDVADVGNPLEGSATRERVNAVSAPDDFELGHVVTTWEGRCSEPTLRITLADGECPDGGGHDLTIRFTVEDLRAGLVGPGQNPIQPRAEGGAMEVTYTRPENFTPAGEWGNCPEAIGIVDLLGDLSLEEDTHVEGRFQLELTACDGSGNDPVSVNGEFNGPLVRGVEDLCP